MKDKRSEGPQVRLNEQSRRRISAARKKNSLHAHILLFLIDDLERTVHCDTDLSRRVTKRRIAVGFSALRVTRAIKV